MLKPAVFLDRDGTIIEDVGYLHRFDQIAFFPWTVDVIRCLNRAGLPVDVIRCLNRAGLPVVVITNQSGVARGMFDEAFVQATHDHLDARLAAGGARIDAYYYCPHHPAGKVERYARACDCRKPATGLVERAAQALGLDPTRSFVVGDTWLDIGVANAVGAQGILVRTGGGTWHETRRPDGLTAAAVVDNLAAAASWILARSLKLEV